MVHGWEHDHQYIKDRKLHCTVQKLVKTSTLDEHLMNFSQTAGMNKKFLQDIHCPLENETHICP